MSEELGADATSGGVSAGRKKASTILLIVLLVVLAVELRAGLGHMMTAKALEQLAPDGVYNGDVTYADVKAALKLAPTESVAKESQDEIEYRYGWFSILRPVLRKPESAFYVVFSNDDRKLARRHGTEGPDPEEIEAARRAEELADMPADDSSTMGMSPGGPGGGGPGGPDGPGGGGPGGGGGGMGAAYSGAGGHDAANREAIEAQEAAGGRRRPPIDGNEPKETEEGDGDAAKPENPPEAAPEGDDAEGDTDSAPEPTEPSESEPSAE